jgi:hypothetical protein
LICVSVRDGITQKPKEACRRYSTRFELASRKLVDAWEDAKGCRPTWRAQSVTRRAQFGLTHERHHGFCRSWAFGNHRFGREQQFRA